jgi:hypothetical protein
MKSVITFVAALFVFVSAASAQQVRSVANTIAGKRIAVIDARFCEGTYRGGRLTPKQLSDYKRAQALAKKNGEDPPFYPIPEQYQGLPLRMFLQSPGHEFLVKELFYAKEDFKPDVFKNASLVVRVGSHGILLKPEEATIYEDYVKQGGRLLLCHDGGVDKVADKFGLKFGEGLSKPTFVWDPFPLAAFSAPKGSYVEQLPASASVFGQVMTRQGPKAAAGVISFQQGKVFFLASEDMFIWQRPDILNNILLALDL